MRIALRPDAGDSRERGRALARRQQQRVLDGRFGVGRGLRDGRFEAKAIGVDLRRRAEHANDAEIVVAEDFQQRDAERSSPSIVGCSPSARSAALASRLAQAREHRRHDRRLEVELARQCGRGGRIDLAVTRQEQLERLRAARELGQCGDLRQQRFERRSIGVRREAIERSALRRVDGACDELEKVHGARCAAERCARPALASMSRRGRGAIAASSPARRYIARTPTDESGAEEQSGPSHAISAVSSGDAIRYSRKLCTPKLGCARRAAAKLP